MFVPRGAKTAAIAGLCMALLLAGCRESPDDEPPLRIVAVDAAAAERLIAENIGMGLTARDARGLVIPGIAQSWRVADDGLSIVFRLRDAHYSDGSTVTARDVVASIRAAIRRPPESVAALVPGIAAISSPLPDVVELVLTTPQPEMLELLADPAFAIRPRGEGRLRAGPYVRQVPDADDAVLFPGTHLGRQAHFFDAGHGGPARATVRVDGAEAAIRHYQDFSAEIVTGAGLEGIGLARTLGTSDALRLETSRAVLMLLVNQREAPLNDRRVRIALSMAIDRDRLGPALFGSAQALPVHALAPSGLRQSLTGAEPDWAALPLAQRQAEARRLLEEAGHGAENPLAILISATDRPGDARLVSELGADLGRIGVTVRLAQRSPAGHDAAVAKGDFALALVSRATPVASVLPFLGPMRCGQNPGGVCIPEADRLLLESWRASSPAERAVALAAAERLWAEDGAAIGLVQPLNWSLVSRRVEGWVSNDAGVRPLRFLSLLPDRRMLS